MTMTKINLERDKIFSGCYDGDKDQWDIYVNEKDIDALPMDLSLSQDGESYWNCYLVSAKWLQKTMQYHLIFKDY